MAKLLFAIAAAALLAVVAGCGMSEQAANASITMAQSALDQHKDKAMEVAPDQFAAIQDSINAARASVARGEAKAALASSQSAIVQTKAMIDSLPARELALRTQWEQMQGIGGGLDQFHKKIDELAAMPRLPAGMDLAQIEAARTSLATMTETWVAAQNSYRTGMLAQAVSEAGAVQQMLTEGMTGLGMSPPD